MGPDYSVEEDNNREGAFQAAGRHEPGKRQAYRLAFDAPRGYCSAWVDKTSVEEQSVPVQTNGYAGLRLVSGAQQTEEPAVFWLDCLELKSLDGAHSKR